MPRATGHPGRRATPQTAAAAVVPPRLAEHYAGAVGGTQTASCAIRRPGTTQSWDEASQSTKTTPHAPHYEGRCRVQALATAPRSANAAEQLVTIAGYLVTVPADVEATDGQLVDVADTGDPMLDGKTLRIREAVLGSIRVERDLLCELG